MISKAKKLIKNYIYFFLTFTAIFAFLLLPIFETLNNLFLDRLHGPLEARKEIVIVGIDDKSLREIGAWPWDRSIFAKALDNLGEAKPAVVGFDILFLEGRTGDEEFAKSISNASYPIVFGSKVIDNQSYETPFISENSSSGYVFFLPDDDGKVRSVILTKRVGEVCKKSFSFAIYSKYLRQKDDADYCSGDNVIVGKNSFSRNMHFSYTGEKFRTISFVDLYRNEVKKEDLKDKIILFGSTATDLRTELQDNFYNVSGSKISGVELHTQVINSLLLAEERITIPISYFYFSMLTICSFLMILLKFPKRSFYDLLIVFGLLFCVNIAGIFMFEYLVNWPFVQASLLIIASYVNSIVLKYLSVQREKDFVKKAFSQYLSPRLLDKLTNSPQSLRLGGERKVMTVLFSDIRGFTSISEKMQPDELSKFLNNYFDIMSEVIMQNNGVIDKFIGDAIMAIWNAPLNDDNHQVNAISAAIEMVAKLEEYKRTLTNLPDFNIGIGINTGEMVVGNLGSHNRFDYTVIGDNVNLASRLEGLTKKYGVNLLITEAVKEGIDCSKQDFICRIVDEVIVKGKKLPVKIYQPMRKTESNIDLKMLYEQGFAKYQQGDFDQATHIWQPIATRDHLVTMMTERIKEIDKANWNGVWEWKEK